MMRGFSVWLAAVMAGAGAALVFGATSFAASAPHLELNPSQGPPGTTVSAQGSGFCTSCGTVEIDFVARPVQQGITVAADGTFQVTFVVPGGAQAGTDAVNAYQQGNLVTQTSFNVTPSSPAPPPTVATPTAAPPPVSSPGSPATPAPGTPAAPQASETPTGGGAVPGGAASPGPGANGGPAAPSSTAAGASGSTGAALRVAGLAVAAVLIAGAAVLVYRRVKARAG